MLCLVVPDNTTAPGSLIRRQAPNQITALACTQVPLSIFQNQNRRGGGGKSTPSSTIIWFASRQTYASLGKVLPAKDETRKSLSSSCVFHPWARLAACPGRLLPQRQPGLPSRGSHRAADNTSALGLYGADLHSYFLLPVNVSCQAGPVNLITPLR